jgi:hypothetical protein
VAKMRRLWNDVKGGCNYSPSFPAEFSLSKFPSLIYRRTICNRQLIHDRPLRRPSNRGASDRHNRTCWQQPHWRLTSQR